MTLKDKLQHAAELAAILATEGAPHGAHRAASDALRLIALGRRASNLAVRLCNGEGRQRGRWDDVDEARYEKAKERIRRDASSIAAHYNATVDVGGDPRGYVLKLHLQSKRSNSFADNTWGVG